MSTQQTDLIIKMTLTAWLVQNKNFAALLDKLSDEAIAAEASPGRNTGTYLLGHLTAVSDQMFKLLGLREVMFPELYEPFVKTPDKSGQSMPAVTELRSQYHTITNELNEFLKNMTAEEWLSKHTVVSEEDFAKEPTRNKLNILISRTNHLSGHLGQMLYLQQQ